MTPEFWRGKRVLVTGHTGFKGGWLTLWLDLLGARVSGVALAPTSQPNLFEAAAISEIGESRLTDVRDATSVRACVREARPDVVFHLAAQSLVRPSYAEPVETYATNVLGTVHVLDAVRTEPSARAVVIVTSDKCYENREWIWGYRESEAMGGHDPYSSSKGCAELVTSAYQRSFFEAGPTGVASARAGNVIGGGDWSEDRLIPDVYRAATARQPVRIRNPKAVRPWQHVLEPLAGYLLLAERLWDDAKSFSGGWNFGPSENDARQVGEVMDQIVALWGDGLGWELDQGAHPHEAMLLRLDCSKARHALGWRPRLDLRQALSWTVEWYKAFERGASVRELSYDQIRRYSAMGNA